MDGESTGLDGINADVGLCSGPFVVEGQMYEPLANRGTLPFWPFVLQVLSINDECWLVLDAPYYQLKVWPLSILQDDAGRFALLDAGEWRAKARRQCSFLPTRV